MIDLLRIDLGMEIAHVIHLLFELLHAGACQFLVVDHRCLAHLMGIARETFLRFSRGIAWGGVIDIQLQFPEAQDLGVLALPQVAA